MKLSTLAFAVALPLSLSTAPVRAVETDCGGRDPSTIVKSAGLYWVYATGRGVPEFSSPDRLHWTYRGDVFPAAPGWVAETVPANRTNFAWAPDVHFFHSKWHLYYAFSSFGSKISGIGLATNDTLEPRNWVDQGLVIQSGPGTNFNAIDPGICLTSSKIPWMCFGSFYGGIKLVKLNPGTGKCSASNPAITTLAEHPQSHANAIEAAEITFHHGYYFLFVNWDSCCRGAKSTYNIRVGRSRTVTGPYLDKTGLEMTRGGGSPFLDTVKKSATKTDPDEIGPGHAGVLFDTNGTYFSCHYEWAKDRQGRTTVNLLKLTWDGDGWPQAAP